MRYLVERYILSYFIKLCSYLITYQCSCFYGYIASFALLRYCHCQTCCCSGVTAHKHSSRRYSSSSTQQLTLCTRGRVSRVLVWLQVETSFEAFLSLSKVVVGVMWRIYKISYIEAHCHTHMHTDITKPILILTLIHTRTERRHNKFLIFECRAMCMHLDKKINHALPT